MASPFTLLDIISMARLHPTETDWPAGRIMDSESITLIEVAHPLNIIQATLMRSERNALCRQYQYKPRL